ncbi:hypothetical protein GALL_86440 [mine drainage metagenome]|uniref:Serine/threonine protein phosphatase n=1 Tax=mine drainage metagenome TaxID=410659 RepID=A0A1J5TA67_9ZZZZ
MSEQTLFATLRAESRIWAVAAIHGAVDRLRALHGQLGPLFEPGDQLVYLGNYSGHGPAVRETIDELLLFRRALLALGGVECDDIVYLRGGQEEMWHKLLQLQLAPNPQQVLHWMVEQGIQPTIEAYGARVDDALLAARDGILSLTKWTSQLRQTLRGFDGHTALTSVLRHAAFTADGSLLFVHAGIDPSRPLLAQSDSFWWGGGSFQQIEEPFEHYRRIVRGYDRRHGGVQETAATMTLDANCGFGGPLLAACFAPGGELINTISA